MPPKVEGFSLEIEAAAIIQEVEGHNVFPPIDPPCADNRAVWSISSVEQAPPECGAS
jgi:hypothetical protein